jgi:hypothetical protein
MGALQVGVLTRWVELRDLLGAAARQIGLACQQARDRIICASPSFPDTFNNKDEMVFAAGHGDDG